MLLFSSFQILFQNFSSFYSLPDIYFIDQLFIVAGHLFFDNLRTYTIMYMGSGGWLPAFGMPSVQIELHIVQPGNAAGEGAGDGDGRYV